MNTSISPMTILSINYVTGTAIFYSGWAGCNYTELTHNNAHSFTCEVINSFVQRRYGAFLRRPCWTVKWDEDSEGFYIALSNCEAQDVLPDYDDFTEDLAEFTEKAPSLSDTGIEESLSRILQSATRYAEWFDREVVMRELTGF